MEIEPSKSLNYSMHFSRNLETSRLHKVGSEGLGIKSIMDTKTIFSVVFALESTMKETKEIWLVNDPEEVNSGRSLQSESESTAETATYTREEMAKKLQA
mmetsp:Transcript_4733/g.8092  ORF Transcript_4733/g.8092 Transcript_4733/m.8092 type:complete len:100 (-) Transcript_4733:246-545(-)